MFLKATRGATWISFWKLPQRIWKVWEKLSAPRIFRKTVHLVWVALENPFMMELEAFANSVRISTDFYTHVLYTNLSTVSHNPQNRTTWKTISCHSESTALILMCAVRYIYDSRSFDQVQHLLLTEHFRITVYGILLKVFIT